MVDSREKGKRAEFAIRDKLRDKTGVTWERVPGSGAFGQTHGLKGDVYIPPSQGHMSQYCFEVKHYKDEQFSSNVLNPGESQFEKWWSQTVREGQQMNMKPALVFKKDRGDWLIALDCTDPGSSIMIDILDNYIIFGKKGSEVVIGKFDAWLYHIKIGDLIK